MKKFGRFTLALLAFCSLSIGVMASTQEVSHPTLTSASESVVLFETKEVEITDNNTFSPLRSKQHIDESYSGKKDYRESFSCMASQGNTLNIYVKNKGVSTINFKVNMNGESMGTVTVAPGKGKTRVFENPNGITDDFEVIVSTDGGHILELDVEARQYEK